MSVTGRSYVSLPSVIILRTWSSLPGSCSAAQLLTGMQTRRLMLAAIAHGKGHLHGLQMQQANLEMLQRGTVGAPAPQQQQQQPPQQQQLQPQQQQHQQQQPSQVPSSSPADMFNNLASMYGLPSAQPGGATVTTGGPADASAPMASGAQALHRLSASAECIVARQCICKVGSVQHLVMLLSIHFCCHQPSVRGPSRGRHRLHAVILF